MFRGISALAFSAALLMTATLGLSGAANADVKCSCEALTTTGQLNKADLIFRGTAISTGGGFLFSDSVTNFRVQQVLKGEYSDKRIDVRHLGRIRGDCGIDFRRKTMFVVMAFEENGQHRTDRCLMDTEESDAFKRQAQIQKLLGQ